MFIITLTYIQPLTEVEKHLPAHQQYLDEHYTTGNFLVSGRQEPRVGGAIIARADSREALTAIYQKDPFFRHKIAEYHVTECTPSKWAPVLDGWLA